jgi:hypothetical protein
MEVVRDRGRHKIGKGDRKVCDKVFVLSGGGYRPPKDTWG